MKDLRKTAYLQSLLALTLVSLLLFVPAGTLDYWEAWTYLALTFGMVLGILDDLLKRNPALLERRMRYLEKEPRQRWIMGFATLWFVASLVVPGLDQRYGWSAVPAAVVIVADSLLLLGYGIIFRVFRENPFASRVVEVEPDQTVISTGPYARVRHPMYFGAVIIQLASPLALGSYWAILPGILIIPILAARIRNEEEVLARDLEGYREYLEKVRYRLIRGVW